MPLQQKHPDSGDYAEECTLTFTISDAKDAGDGIAVGIADGTASPPGSTTSGSRRTGTGRASRQLRRSPLCRDGGIPGWRCGIIPSKGRMVQSALESPTAKLDYCTGSMALVGGSASVAAAGLTVAGIVTAIPAAVGAAITAVGFATELGKATSDDGGTATSETGGTALSRPYLAATGAAACTSTVAATLTHLGLIASVPVGWSFGLVALLGASGACAFGASGKLLERLHRGANPRVKDKLDALGALHVADLKGDSLVADPTWRPEYKVGVKVKFRPRYEEPRPFEDRGAGPPR
eukprot:3703279-Prymnesium_polylepis.1